MFYCGHTPGTVLEYSGCASPPVVQSNMEIEPIATPEFRPLSLQTPSAALIASDTAPSCFRHPPAVVSRIDAWPEQRMDDSNVLRNQEVNG
jgi:hypothetical protein